MLLSVIGFGCSSSSTEEEITEEPEQPETPSPPASETNDMDFWLTNIRSLFCLAVLNIHSFKYL